jgi:hypothetical protein
MEDAMWQVREALLRQRRLRATAKASQEELPRRWSELIVRLNELEAKEQGNAPPLAAGAALSEG